MRAYLFVAARCSRSKERESESKLREWNETEDVVSKTQRELRTKKVSGERRELMCLFFVLGVFVGAEGRKLSFYTLLLHYVL